MVAGRVKATCLLRRAVSCLSLYSCSMYAHTSPCNTLLSVMFIFFNIRAVHQTVDSNKTVNHGCLGEGEGLVSDEGRNNSY